MSDLVRTSANLYPATRAERQAGRAIEQVRARQAIASAEEVARVAVIAETCEAALLAVSHVSALESLLITRTPLAEERLRHIADAGALGMTQVVLSVNRRMK